MTAGNTKNKALRRDFRAAAPGRRGGGAEAPPRWKLEELYASPASAGMEKDLTWIEEESAAFAADYGESMEQLSGAEMGKAVARYETLETARNKIMAYIGLLEAEDSGNYPRTENVKKRLGAAGGETAFFGLAFANMPETELLSKMTAPELAAYGPWIAQMRADRKYLLDDALETLVDDYIGRNAEAWSRLYRETIDGLRVVLDGKSVPLDAARSRLSGKPGTGQAAAVRNAIGEALQKESRKVALIYNAIVRDGLIDMETRGYSRPDAEEHGRNAIDPETVDAVAAAARAAQIRLSHKYHHWRAALHGRSVIPMALLQEAAPGLQGPEKTYTWDEARRTVLRAFRSFSPRHGRMAQKFFDAGHIDAAPAPGKDGGAFCQPVAPGVYPYILLSFTGGLADVVSSLAHELGHGIHQVLAESAQGTFLSSASTPVSETASLFSEMLALDEITKGETDPRQQQALLACRAASLLDGLMRQLSYHDFECRVHDARRHGELDAEKISDIWVETQRAYFGPAVETDLYDRYDWMLTPHFFFSPFYVCSYAVAQMMVNALYVQYEEARAQGPEAREAFVSAYTEMLEAGNTKNFRDAFAPFGFDTADPAFWQKGLRLAEDTLDALMKTAPPAPVKKPPAPPGP